MSETLQCVNTGCCWTPCDARNKLQLFPKRRSPAHLFTRGGFCFISSDHRRLQEIFAFPV